jgi:phosphoenolpyruvate-protein phosphotransferase
VFGAQALMLGSGSFLQGVRGAIERERLNAEAAVTDAVDRLAATFDAMADAYLRDRAVDVRDVGRRVLAALGARGRRGLDVPEGAIVVARELLPSVSARLQLERVAGFVTERGSTFSHASILARSRGTPAVTAVEGAVHAIHGGDHLVVDGATGRVLVNPAPAVREEFARVDAGRRARRERLRRTAAEPALTRDGAAVALLANVGHRGDVDAALEAGAEGAGLVRTELAFATRDTLPTEDDLHAFALRVAERFHPRRVVLRLLDLGGDKAFPFLPLPPSRNPSLAPRGTRLLLRHRELLAAQLRAFLRAGAEHPIAILLPVVSGVPDLREVRRMLAAAQDAVEAAGGRFGRDVPLGAMLEVPSAVLVAPALARHVDFFSLGTNDLVQYVLAADREDDGVPSPYQPLHPAVLRMIRAAVVAARRARRPLTICGDMAGEPLHAEVLLGLGLRSFSVAPGALLGLKRALRGATLPEARALARAALAAECAEDVEAMVRARAEDPDDA